MHRIFDFSLICKSKHWIRYWANKLQHFQMVVCSTCRWIFSSKRKTWWCIILWGKDLNTVEHMIPIWKLCVFCHHVERAGSCRMQRKWAGVCGSSGLLSHLFLLVFFFFLFQSCFFINVTCIYDFFFHFYLRKKASLSLGTQTPPTWFSCDGVHLGDKATSPSSFD